VWDVRLLLGATLAFLAACAARRPPGAFRVLPAKPSYVLRAPDAQETAFPEVPGRFTRTTSAWVELRPGMELRIENAYYRDGTARRDLGSYLGTEIARFRVQPNGSVRLRSVESGVAQPPAGQAPVQQLIRASAMRYRFYRFFYEVVFNRKGELRGAVLLGARSASELDRLAAQLAADPASVCGGASPRCTVFPETCTVALEMEIVVNGAPRSVLWGSFLASVVKQPRRLELLRVYGGRLTPVELDAADPAALRLPLLPGDRVTWE